MGRVPWAGLRSAADTYCAPLPGVFTARRELPDYIVELPGTWELHQQLSVNMRKNLRKAYQVHAREGFAFALRVTERPEAVQPPWRGSSRCTRRGPKRQT